MKRIIRATTDPSISEREKEHMVLARHLAADGIVLLENNGILPLKEHKLALYGCGARQTLYSGTGSGEMNPRHTVSYEEGLLNAGFEITTGAWLDAYEKEYVAAEKAWQEKLAALRSTTDKMGGVELKSKNPFVPPVGLPTEKTETDTALYVLSRRAGEGSDRRTEEGDYYIRQTEFDTLKNLCRQYPNVVLVLNVCGVMDLSFLDSLPLAAVVLSSLGGMEAGHGLADVLSGRSSPSGKLTDTWARRYEDYPCFDTYSYRDGNPNQEEYQEGIYVGYRWFDAWNIQPRYPFGYGRSYTEFSLTPLGIEQKGSDIAVRVLVENVGKIYSGREVAQLYIASPRGRLDKARKGLVAFGKTNILAPGQKQELTLSFPLSVMASYEEATASWLLEKGEYGVLLGSSAADVSLISVLCVPDDHVTEQCRNLLLPKEVIRPIIPPYAPVTYPAEVRRLPLELFALAPLQHSYELPVSRNNKVVDGMMKRLSTKDKIRLLVGESYLGAAQNTVFGCSGKTTAAFVKYGIPDLPLCDGPQGLDVLPKAIHPRQNFCNVSRLPKKLNRGIVKWLMQRVPEEGYRGKVYYQYASMFPCETMVAQSWDTDLARRMGDAIGREMEELGVAYWLGPGMNLHRNPLCGRNYEYYSEDSFLTGAMACAAVEGVQKHEGCSATLKHFAANNQEDHRNLTDAIVSERALREIYLPAFARAVKESGAKAVMGAYNKINGVYCCNNQELLTQILRCEWGFEGVVMTDWWATGHDDCYDELAFSAGCDLIMPGFPNIKGKIHAALKAGRITGSDIDRAAENVLKAALERCAAKK